ncbi:MAG: enoyl-CoA hydratase/isomerase family protein [Chloroflexi bacterium]|nr:enoyl-CoA hydratase/isomerase family protein [Chloroflexota bacterium]
MDYQDIIYTKEEGIATITLNRPNARNSFSPAMLKSFYRALEDVAKDDKVRVLVLTGAGQAFCTGADVKSMAQHASQPGGEEASREPGVTDAALYLQVHRLEKPVIAAINGVAVGGGLDLALVCDIRIASDRARLASVFVRRGIIPMGGGTYFLPRLVGVDRACQLIWTGDMVDAKEAERIGLVTMVVPHEELESATRELAEKILKNPPLAIKAAKRVIYAGLDMDLEANLEYIAPILKELRATEDHKEGARAFVEKREPVFKGK